MRSAAGRDDFRRLWDDVAVTAVFLATSATSWERLSISSLAKMWRRWVFTVGTLMNSRSAACLLVSPSATARATSASVGVSAAQPDDGPNPFAA